MSEITALNEFVIRFANVNGTGSASANHLFAKSVFRMGLPVSPRNIFPSNIQGLPTWYEVRVSEAGHLGRRGGVDIAVAMNPATFREDVDGLLPGGYVLYDSTKYIDRRRYRSDIHWLGVPLTELCLAAYDDPRQRQLFKNIAYVGALAALLDMEFDTVTGLVADQFKGKDRLIAPNVKALELGHEWARANLDCPIGIRVRRSDAVGERILTNGNSAAALGCVYAGATVAGWYPITPSTSLVDAFASYCERLRVDPETGDKNFAVLQAEDELAAIGMAIGACWNGARGFTATSGPGISLMTEFLGLAWFAEVPVVLFNIQRGGPSTGMPTRTQQADLLACAYASHGDTRHLLLFPKDPHEAFEDAANAFDLAERVQTPVIVMSDLDLGMNDWTTEPFAWDDARRYDRGKVLDAARLEELKSDWGRYLDMDSDGIPWRTIPGTHPDHGAYLVRGTSHDEYARYTESGDVYQRVMDRIGRKFETAAELMPAPEIIPAEHDTLMGVVYFGTTTAAMGEALEQLRAEGIELDALRIRAFPFGREVFEFISRHASVFVVEQNREGQMRTLLMNEGDIDPASLVSVLHYDGLPITSSFIVDSIRERLTLQETGGTWRVERRVLQEAD